MRISVFAIFLLFFSYAHAGVRSALGSLKIIKIKSNFQKIVDRSKVVLDGDVEVLLDHKIHMWADHVEIYKEKQTIIAKSKDDSFVKIENPNLLMLADCVELNLGTKTGHADNIKIHVKDGFLSSSKAEKIDDQTWQMKRITYTSCDRSTPHWAFFAHKAVLYKNSVLKASGLIFKIHNVPLFAFPALIFPLQNRAGSGFLMPRLSFDAELGFGFRQEYYYLLGDHCDTTVGFNFVQKKGFVISDEFRWAKSAENYLIMDSNYAAEWNAIIEKRGKIIRATDRHYWIQGKYFQPIFVGDLNIQSLISFDFGTDKRVGYHFLNDVEKVEDSFYNTIIERYSDKNNTMQFMVHCERSLRRQFVDLPKDSKTNKDKKKEREEKVTISYLPHFEWNTKFLQLFKNFFYRHNLIIDQVFLDSRTIEKTYVGDYVEKFSQASPKLGANTGRFLYEGIFRSLVRFGDQHIDCFVRPNLQVRGKVKRRGHYKLFVRTGVEWSFPERMVYSSNYKNIHYMQPIIRWSYLPKFYQNDWYYIDKRDRSYPENVLEFVLRNNWKLNNLYIDLLLNQGYEFYNSSDIMPLRRCYNQKHLAPFRFKAECNLHGVNASISQEYSWASLSMIQSEIMAHFSWKKYNFFLGYLYQKESLQKNRELLSDIPAFALIGISLPLGKQLQINYDGGFYSKYKHLFPMFNTMKPMLHRIRLDYEGHCWGFSLGWEEKRYRQYGNWKSERAVTLALRLESVGSFAQKFRNFRRPLIHRAPASYKG
jgi:hypothetical protein